MRSQHCDGYQRIITFWLLGIELREREPATGTARGYAVPLGVLVPSAPSGDHRALHVAVPLLPLSFREVEGLMLACGIVVS
jgi:hypothetical protein